MFSPLAGIWVDAQHSHRPVNVGAGEGVVRRPEISAPPWETVRAALDVPGWMAFAGVSSSYERAVARKPLGAVQSKPVRPQIEDVDRLLTWDADVSRPVRQVERAPAPPVNAFPLIEGTPEDRDDMPWAGIVAAPVRHDRRPSAIVAHLLTGGTELDRMDMSWAGIVSAPNRHTTGPRRNASDDTPAISAVAVEFYAAFGWQGVAVAAPRIVRGRPVVQDSLPEFITGPEAERITWMGSGVAGTNRHPRGGSVGIVSRDVVPVPDAAMHLAWTQSTTRPANPAATISSRPLWTMPPPASASVVTVAVAAPWACYAGEVSWAGANMGDVTED